MKGVGSGVWCVPVPKNIRFLHEKVRFGLLVVKRSLKWQYLTLIPKKLATSWQIIWEGLCPLYPEIKAPNCVIGPRAACSLTFTLIIMRSVTTDYPMSWCVSLSVTRLHSPKTAERFAVCGRDYCWPKVHCMRLGFVPIPLLSYLMRGFHATIVLLHASSVIVTVQRGAKTA